MFFKKVIDCPSCIKLKNPVNRELTNNLLRLSEKDLHNVRSQKALGYRHA